MMPARTIKTGTQDPCPVWTWGEKLINGGSGISGGGLDKLSRSNKRGERGLYMVEYFNG